MREVRVDITRQRRMIYFVIDLKYECLYLLNESQLGLGSSKEISSKRKVNALSGFSARQPV